MKNYKAWIISRKNLKVIFNMEENIQEVKQAKLYVNASWRRPKDQRKTMNRKEGKNKGKLIFLRRNAFTEGSEKKMIRLFMENCEGQGKGKGK